MTGLHREKQGAQHPETDSSVEGGVYGALTQLMYGVIGVTLPAACVLGLKGVRWWLLPAALAMFAIAGAAVLLGVALLRQPMSCTVWPVGRWGYWFYLGHLAAIYLMKL